jgi:tetratricopeptide (TPR) repeat protein
MSASEPARKITAAELPALLRQAVAASRAGRFDDVIGQCQRILADMPDQPDTLFLLAGALHGRERHDEAIEHLRRAIALAPHRADYVGNLGAVLARRGRLDEAIECFRQAIQLEPRSPAGHTALGNALQAKGDLAAAISSFRVATTLGPIAAGAHLNLGNALRAAGRVDEAMESYRQALKINPHAADAHHNLGAILLDGGRTEEAAASLRAALATQPDHLLASRLLALALIAEGKTDEASELIMAQVRRRHAIGGDGAAPILRQTNPVKLRHDIDQLGFLHERKLASIDLETIIGDHRAALRATGARLEGPVELPNSATPTLRAHYNRLIHVRDTPAMAGGALSPAWFGGAIEAEFRWRDPGFAWWDGLLRPEALNALHRYCVESTVWFQTTFKNEVSATLFNGFCCPLLLQIAGELRQRLPGLLGDKPLALAWAYKYCGDFSGLGIHADDGAVSVNFWITPDEANLDETRGGLILWERKVPEDYLRRDRDTQQRMIRDIVENSGKAPVTVPYRCNRALVFDSMIAHSTDRFQFRDDYESRRINITLLYGRAR